MIDSRLKFLANSLSTSNLAGFSEWSTSFMEDVLNKPKLILKWDQKKQDTLRNKIHDLLQDSHCAQNTNIQEMLTSLSSEDLVSFSNWLIELFNDKWDKDIENDAAHNRLDEPLNQALQDIKSGNTFPLEESVESQNPQGSDNREP